MASMTLKCHKSFENQNNRKATRNFSPRSLTFKLQEEVLKFNHICTGWGSPKTDIVTNFLNVENQGLENVSLFLTYLLL